MLSRHCNKTNYMKDMKIHIRYFVSLSITFQVSICGRCIGASQWLPGAHYWWPRAASPYSAPPRPCLRVQVQPWQWQWQCGSQWNNARRDEGAGCDVRCKYFTRCSMCVCLVWGWGLVTAAAMLLCCCPQLHHQQQERGGQRTSPPRVLAADTAGYLCPALQPGNLYTHAAVTYLSLKCDIKMYFYWGFLCTHLHYMSSRAPAMNRFYRQRLCKSSSWSSLLVFILKFFNEVHRKYKNTIFGEGLYFIGNKTRRKSKVSSQ